MSQLEKLVETKFSSNNVEKLIRPPKPLIQSKITHKLYTDAIIHENGNVIHLDSGAADNDDKVECSTEHSFSNNKRNSVLNMKSPSPRK